MGNYQRLLSVVPEIGERHTAYEDLLRRVALVTAFLPGEPRRTVAELAAEFSTLLSDYLDEVDEGFEQVAIVNRLSAEKERLERLLHIACGVISALPEFADRHPTDVLGWLEESL
jgi:hypothetical protein